MLGMAIELASFVTVQVIKHMSDDDKEKLKNTINNISKNRTDYIKYKTFKISDEYKTYKRILIQTGIQEKMNNNPLYEITDDELKMISDEFKKRTGKNLEDVINKSV